jgi:uncharacterized protein
MSRHSVEHFEIPADRTEELKGFYSSLFGWQFEKGQTQYYWMIRNAGISGGLAPKENQEQMPTMFVTVESVDDYISKAKRLDARIVKAGNRPRLLCCPRRPPEEYLWDLAGQIAPRILLCPTFQEIRTIPILHNRG